MPPRLLKSRVDHRCPPSGLTRARCGREREREGGSGLVTGRQSRERLASRHRASTAARTRGLHRQLAGPEERAAGHLHSRQPGAAGCRL